MTDGICFVGLDVHARKTAAAAVQLGSGEVFKAQLSGSPEAALQWFATLPGPVRAVYEGGPTGFGLARAARAAGVEMMVSVRARSDPAPGAPAPRRVPSARGAALLCASVAPVAAARLRRRCCSHSSPTPSIRRGLPPAAASLRAVGVLGVEVVRERLPDGRAEDLIQK